MSSNRFRFLIALLVCLCLLAGCEQVPDAHRPVNGLPETVEVLVFRDGSLVRPDGSLFAPDVYDADADDPLYAADYAFAVAWGRLLYRDTADVLWLTDGETRKKIAERPAAWYSAADLSAVAFTLKNQGSDAYGSLFLFDDAGLTPVDADVLIDSVRFSQDGKKLFYQKPGGQAFLLFAFENGKKALKADDALPLLWVNTDGSAVVTGQADVQGFTYRFYARDFRKSLTVPLAAEAAVSEDQRFVWLRTQGGLLKTIALANLKDKVLAENVSAFSVAAVTDDSRGAVYLVCDNADQELYSLYYTDTAGHSTRLMHAVSADAAAKAALNTRTGTGYLLVGDGSRTDGRLYRVTLGKDGLRAETADTGTVTLPVYYETSDSLLYLKDVTVSDGQLYLVNGSSVRSFGTVGLVYENGSPCPAAQASSDGQCVFLSRGVREQTIGSKTVWTGDPVIVSAAGERAVGTDWVLSSLWAPAMNGDLSVIYGLKKTEDGLVLHRVTAAGDEILLTNVDGLLTVS